MAVNQEVKRKNRTANAGEGMENVRFVGMQIGTATMETSMET